MGEFVDDIRAALVMNPNFCRLRYKKDEAVPKKNGFSKNGREESNGHKNSLMCDIVEEIEKLPQDSNGNVFLQIKELNPHSRKVTFKDERSRNLFRRHSSDIEIRDSGSKKQNCARCSPNVQILNPNSIVYENRGENIQSECIISEDRVEEGSCNHLDHSPVDDMDVDCDSKYASSDSLSKESFCDVEVQHSGTLTENNPSLLEKPIDATDESESTFLQSPNEILSLDDILTRYSSILDENSLQVLQKSIEIPECGNSSKRMSCTSIFILIFILTPTLLFYLLIFLYLFRPEPIYSVLLTTLKLKDEPQLSILLSFIELIKSVYFECCEIASEKFEGIININ